MPRAARASTCRSHRMAGLSTNENARALISMMARSKCSNQRPDTLMQDRSPPARRNHLRRTAGPYIRVIRVTLTVRRLLPVFPYEQTSIASVGMSQKCQFLLPAHPPGHSPEEGSTRASALRHPLLVTLMLVAPGDRAGRVPGGLDALDLLADLARGRAERVDANLAVRHAGAQRA